MEETFPAPVPPCSTPCPACSSDFQARIEPLPRWSCVSQVSPFSVVHLNRDLGRDCRLPWSIKLTSPTAVYCFRCETPVRHAHACIFVESPTWPNRPPCHYFVRPVLHLHRRCGSREFQSTCTHVSLTSLMLAAFDPACIVTYIMIFQVSTGRSASLKDQSNFS